ncbi:MAG: O-methyltransferase [Flavobacteriales bacterium]
MWRDALFELRVYCLHTLKAGGRHSVHSPLVYELLDVVLAGKKEFYCFEEIEEARKNLLADDSVIEVSEMGAGSRFSKSSQRYIAQIAQHSLQSKHCAQALFKIVQHYQCKNILELGTSLGITTAYLAKTRTDAMVHTIEGSEEIMKHAKQVFAELDIKNAIAIHGNFDHELKPVLEKMKRVDFALIDGNHRYEPTVNYVSEIIKHCHVNSIIVLDDIHWSAEMERAWKEVAALEQVSISIDFFHFGLLFLRSGVEKQRFVLRLP